MSVIIFCALLGLVFGGMRGLLIGVLLGYGAKWAFAPILRSRLQQGQARFLDSTFAVMGALSKADGVVSRDEIQVAQQIFDMLRLSGARRDQAKDAFNRGKAANFDLDAEVDRLRGAIAFGRGPLLRLFLHLQCMAVAADGRVHEAEHAMLVHIAQRLGLTARDVAQLEALLRAGAGAAAGPRPAPSKDRLDDAYTALGLTPDVRDAEVKRAYRRLVSENHPDKLAAKGLPESMRQVAEERTREINVAYDLIKESRRLLVRN
jgi:DnaJ like chaperone protein